MSLAPERREEFCLDDVQDTRYLEGQRYEAIVDPMDQHVVWDLKTGMPAVLHGHVLYLPEEQAKAVATLLNEGRTLSAGFIEAMLGDEAFAEEEVLRAVAAPGF